MKHVYITLALALALCAGIVHAQVSPPFVVPSPAPGKDVRIDAPAVVHVDTPGAAAAAAPAPIIMVQAGPTLQEQAAALATVLASLAALITALRTHKVVNSRMDKYETIAAERFGALATLKEKEAQAGREAVAAQVREHDALGDPLASAAIAAKKLIDDAALAAAALIAAALPLPDRRTLYSKEPPL